MGDKPIVLTKPNVCAVLERRKFQTRRIINPQPYETEMCPVIVCIDVQSPSGYTFASDRFGDRHIKSKLKVGERAYVAEGYQIEQYTFRRNCVGGKYLADNKEFWTEVYQREYDLIKNRKFPLRPTPGRFMYKSLARIFLPIVEVRVERLQDISESDIISEGCPEFTSLTGEDELYAARQWWWNELWKSIHGKGALDDNPWVRVYRWDEIIIKGK